MSIQLQGQVNLDFTQADAQLENFRRKLSSKDFSQPLGRISGDAAEFRKSLEAATARVTAFGLTAGAIYKVSEAIRAGARATIEVDKQLVELNTFLGQSKNQLEDFSRSLFKVARNAAVPFEAASEAAKEFARQGLSTNEVLKRTEDALTLARISGINYGDAVNGITTAINSFNKEALSSTDIINKLIAVDTRFAVSSAQLNEALTRVGSSAEESGISIDKLIATVTAAQQITGRGGAVIGNALKTIFTRLQRPEVITQLQQLGVSVKDQNGFLLDGISILKNYADATKNLSQIEKSRTAELIGGIYQINQVNALIKDLSSSNSVYANALRISTTATDEAKKKNEELNKSMSALLQNTKNQAQEAAAVLGKSMLEPMVRIGSEFTKMALKFVNPESDLLGSAEKGGESLGSSFAKGAASALGKTLATGGIPLAIGVGGTLLAKMAKFGVSSVRNISKDYQSIFSEKTLIAQERINDLLRQNPSLITSVQNKTMTLAQVEQKLLDLIKLQNRELAVQASIRARVVPTVVSKGGPGKIRAGGYIPNFAMSAEQEEVATAKAYGAKNPVPRVIQATIRGKTGPVVVNNQEKVIPNFAGTRETAIIPNYRNIEDVPRMSSGYVPNFAFSYKLPPEPNSTAIPENFVRLFHQTSLKNLASIKRSGITINKALGIEGPMAIYADEKGFYGSPEDRPSVEFAVNKNRFSSPPFVQGGDVKPSEIVAIHKPWHKNARYIENNPEVLKAVLAGEHDDLTDDVGKAIRFIKRKYKSFNSSGAKAKASGYVPNFSGIPGSFGSVSKINEKQIRKTFFSGAGQSGAGEIANEFLASRKLSEQIQASRELGYQGMRGGYISDLFNAPHTYGTLKESIKSGSLVKDFVPGKTAKEIGENIDKYTGEYKNYYELVTNLGRLSAKQITSGKAMEARDLANFGNLMLNKKAEDLITKIVARKGGERLVGKMNSSWQTTSRVAEALARQGARISLVDPGIFAGLDKRRKKELGKLGYEDNYREMTGVNAAGFIPNFAKKDKYKFPKISSEKMESNIARNFEKLSPGDQKYFARAYEDYNNLIKVFSKASGTSPEKFANVMSALSPANPLERNALDALRYNLFAKKKLSTIASPIFLDEREIGSVKAQTYGANRTKAANLIAGLEKLTGNKRKAFLNNMLDPFGSQDVTVDYRAQGDALNKKFNVKNAPTMNREQYDKVSQAFRSVGSRAGVSGLGVQAATWIGGRMGSKAARGQDFNRGILKFFYDNPDKISLENLEFLLSVPGKGKARSDFFKKASAMGVSKLGSDSLISISRAGGYIPNFSGLSDSINREKTMTGLPASQIMTHFDKSGNPIAVTNKKDEPNGLKDVVPNFAAPRVNFSALSRSVKNLFSKLKGSSPAGAPADAGAGAPSSGQNPISGSFELFAAQGIQSVFDELAEREVISASTAKFAGYAIPGAVGGKNIYKALTDKSMSKGQKALTGLTGLAQAGGGAFLASKTSGDLDQRIQNKKLSEEIDNAKRNFQNLTENTSELATTLSKLDAAYKDPKADPREITKLVKSREDIIKKITIKNPELVSKLAGQESLTGKIDLLEENQKEQQRILSLKESASAFRSKGKISGADAPGQLAAFFEEAINRGGSDLLKQDFNNATPANFAEILKKGGLDIKEFSSVFNSDDLKKSFISSLKLAQELQAISTKQDQDIREKNKPLAEARQRVGDAREIRARIKETLEQQLPELASFAGGFSKRAGISASAEASLAIKKSDAAVAFQNSLLAQLNDKEFLKGLPPEVERALSSIEAPGESTARELQKLEKLPGLGAEQVRGIQRLIDFNSVQTRDLTKSTIIAEESKKIQLKFLALQEKAAFGGDIRTSINPQMRADAMNAGIRGPLTYQLGGLIGSRRSQVAGATDFITDTLQRYPGLLQTKDGKEPRDIQAVKGELTQLNALDMQKDLLKRAGMAQMMGLGQTASLLQAKAFDPRYLLESAGLKASALFESPDVPKEVRDAMKGYEQFNVNSVRAGREEDKFLRREEERGAPIKEKIVEESAKQAKVLAEKFEAALKSTFGANGITTTSMNVTATGDVKFGQAKAGEDAGVPSSANGLTKYSSSVADAVKREKTALASRGIMGVPNFAMADINLERSPDLVNASNPAGFAITNSIDEKNGLRSLGMRSSGFVPNYALPSFMSASNLDKVRSVFTNADDARSLAGNIKEGDIGGAAMDLAGPALDAAKFAAKNVAKKAGLGAAGIGLDLGEYVVKPLSEKLGVTDYLADRMYNALYAKPEKSNIARASDAYNSRLGNDLIDPSPEYMKKAKVPYFAKSSNIDPLLERIYGPRADIPKATPSVPAPIQGVSQKTMPFFPERLVNETYPFGNRPSIANVNPTVKPGVRQPAQDPSTGKFLSNSAQKIQQDKLAKAAQKAQLAQGTPAGFSSYLKKPGLQEMLALTPEEQARLSPRPARPSLSNVNPFGRVLTKEEVRVFAIKDAKEAKAATLYKRNLLTELERATRPAGVNPIFAQTARESGLAQIGAAKYAERQGSLSRLASPIFDPALDPAKKMSAQELQNRLKITTERPVFANSINARRQREAAAAKAEGVKQAEINRRQNLANKYFQSTADKRAEMRAFSEARQARLGGAAQSGGASLENYLARKDQLTAYEEGLRRGEGRPSFRSDYEQMVKKAKARGLTEEQIAKNISRQKPSFQIFQGEAKPTALGAGLGEAFKSKSLDPKTYAAYKKAYQAGNLEKAAKIASGQTGSAATARTSGLLGSIAKSIPTSGIAGKAFSAGALGLKTLGIAGSAGFGITQGFESYRAAKEGEYGKATLAGLSSAASFAGLIKGAGKVAGPAGVVLGGLGDLKPDLTLAEDWSDIFGRKKRTYSVGPDGKTKEDVESIGLGDIAGTGLAAATALPALVGLLGYRTGNILENKLGIGTKLGDLAAGSMTARASYEAGIRPKGGMTVNEAVKANQLVAKKSELVGQINKLNQISGNPLISRDFQISTSRRGQEFEEDQRIEELKKRLDEENRATRAGITSRATAAGAAETARLNKESAAEEEARNSKLRKIFLESFNKNAESAGYLTTQDKANYLLSQEGKNGLGSFKSTDFKDAEFARSFNNYKAASEAEAAREANRVIPKSAIEFRNRPMPSFPQDVLEEATKTGRSAERVIQDREEINIRRGATSQGMAMPEINAQMSRDYTSATGMPDFPKDVLEEATRRRVTAEQVMQERAGGRVPNFAAMSNSMMSSGDVYSRMRSSASRNAAPSYAQGAVPNFAAAGFTDAITEALKTGITSAFPNGGSSSNVSNSNVINIDGRTSIQNAPDEAMQGIIGILFDKIPELKKLGPAALNFKR